MEGEARLAAKLERRTKQLVAVIANDFGSWAAVLNKWVTAIVLDRREFWFGATFKLLQSERDVRSKGFQ